MYQSYLVNLRSIKWEITRNFPLFWMMQPKSRSFSFVIGLSAKKRTFYLIFSTISSLVWKESVPKCLIIFDEPKGGVNNLFFKVILRPILPIKHWTNTYRRWNMYCIERIRHLRNPISYKGTLQIFHDFKEN